MTESACAKKPPTHAFKSCSNCEFQWKSLEAFIEDPKIQVVGYMPTFDDLLKGLFLFNHHCGTTLDCQVGLFRHLYDGPVYRTCKRGQAECPRHCLNQSELSPCPVHCNCAYVRETLQIIKQWPKAADTLSAAGGRYPAATRIEADR